MTPGSIADNLCTCEAHDCPSRRLSILEALRRVATIGRETNGSWMFDLGLVIFPSGAAALWFQPLQLMQLRSGAVFRSG